VLCSGDPSHAIRRGIGLWLVNRAVIQLDGELDFSRNNPRGTVVTVRLYGAENGP